jgi:hypothetical protein
VVISKLDGALLRIADKTGGAYVPAEPPAWTQSIVAEHRPSPAPGWRRPAQRAGELFPGSCWPPAGAIGAAAHRRHRRREVAA